MEKVSTMVEMALDLFLFSACVKSTRDGKNHENEPTRKDGQTG
jgi:hypothetical protein